MSVTAGSHWQKKLPGGRILAAPSWLVPGTVADNCRFLAGRVDEVGLLFFETDACLAYSTKELPENLAELPLSWHVHLPVDLPWQEPETCADICLQLLRKVAFLRPNRAVLHPPVHADAQGLLRRFLESFGAGEYALSMLALENIQGCDLLGFENIIEDFHLQVCLDLGHVTAYGQETLLDAPKLLARAGLLHLSAGRPGSDRHLPLTELDAQGHALLMRLLAAAPQDAVLLPEIFSLPGYEASCEFLRQILPASQPSVVF